MSYEVFAGGEYTRISFPKCPSFDTRKILKDSGFQWHPETASWRRRPHPNLSGVLFELRKQHDYEMAATAPTFKAEKYTVSAVHKEFEYPVRATNSKGCIWIHCYALKCLGVDPVVGDTIWCIQVGKMSIPVGYCLD